MDVANRALQRASFEDGRGAGVGGDRIDNPDRGFGRVSASGTKEGPRLQKTIASDIGRHHELCHGVNQICARGSQRCFCSPHPVLNQLTVTHQHGAALPRLLAGELNEGIDGSPCNPKRND